MLLDKTIFSEVLYDIRHGKGVKQKEISENTMSRTTYSKIERGIITPGIFNFYNILSRLNVGFEEFFYIYNSYSFSKRWEIINEFKTTRDNSDVKKLTNIILMCIDFLKNKDDNHIRNIKNVCKALLKVNENDLSKAKSIAQNVWDDLSNRDTWFFDDILLINNIFFIFEGKTMEVMYMRAIKYLSKYEGFQNNLSDNILFSLKFNKLSYDLFCINTTECLLKDIEQLIIQAHRLRKYDIKAVLFIRKGLVVNDDKLIEKGLKILEDLELKELTLSVKNEINISSLDRKTSII